MEEHWDACKNVDLIKIRKMIQGVMCQFQDDRKQSLSILESKLHIHRCRQKPGTCMSEHQKGFKHFIAACEHNGGAQLRMRERPRGVNPTRSRNIA